MTAETLKPFITPSGVDNFGAALEGSSTSSNISNRHRKQACHYLAIGLSVSALVLVAVLLGFTVWNSFRVCQLQTEVITLQENVENMRQRLGLDYLEQYKQFEKEYTNALIDDPDALSDDDEDDDDDDEDDDADLIDEEEDEEDDEEYGDTFDGSVKLPNFTNSQEYEEYMRELNHSYSDEDSSNTNSDETADIFEDLEKFKDSKKKKVTRKSRSIVKIAHELSSNKTPQQGKRNSTHEQVATSEQKLQRKRYLAKIRSQLDANVENNLINPKSSGFVADKPRSLEQLAATPLRPRAHQRRRKLPLMKSAKSLALPLQSKSFTAAAHFHLNRKIPDRHGAIRVHPYSGDMYIGHPSSQDNSYRNYFELDNGVLTILEPGLYYIYAQVCYNNIFDQNGYIIFHNSTPFLTCVNTIPTNEPTKLHTCHTSGLIHLQANETIHIRDFHADRSTYLKDSNNRSYFGLIKI